MSRDARAGELAPDLQVRNDCAPEGETAMARAWANLERVDELLGAGRRARPVLVVLQGGG